MINALTGPQSRYDPPVRAPAETIHSAGCTCGACAACLAAKDAHRPIAHARQGAAPGWRRRDLGNASNELSQNRTLDELTPAEREALRRLRDRDRAVRTAERLKETVAGRYLSGNVRYRYARGPDGKAYAVAAEAELDTEPVTGDPRATLRKAEAIRRAALATMSPDDRVAALRADHEADEARRDLRLADTVRNRYAPVAHQPDATALDLAA